jgi:dihydrofolate reductase
MKISLISAIDSKNSIGKYNQLLIHIPEDLKRFKQLTLNKTVVMGRKTFDSLPNGALPNRLNIVLSKTLFGQLEKPKNTTVVDSIESILECFKGLDEEIFVIGGGEIYKQFLPLADKLYLTEIEHDFNGDTFFPEVDYNSFAKTEESETKTFNNIKYKFVTYETIKN